MLWHAAYVGIGSNLDRPAHQVQRALAALPQIAQTRLVLQSSLYGSTPLGPEPQPDFVNAVAAVLTQLPEPPRVRWGPRRIDLDLLLFDAERLDSPELTLPHPGIVQRNFVLYPLLEVAPGLNVPGRGSVAELAARVDSTGIWRLDKNPKAHGA